MNSDILEMIPSMGINELWEMYAMEYQENHVNEIDFRKVKYGYNILFDIRPFLRWTKGMDGFIKANEKSQTIQLARKKLNRSEFDDEIDKRKATMRKTLIEIYSQDGDTTVSRLT